jgi:serine/threonine protein kinase
MPRAATSDRFGAGARIGDYLVEETAVVYLATHVVLPRRAYLKVTHPGSRVAAVQLLREACILEALSHSGIPRVHECGMLADRRSWCAIEMMPGITFKQLAGDGPLALSDLVVALRDLADILRHAHERGVVHRRLTASTIVRSARRRSIYAISDWSDARTLDADSDVIVDPKDDIHALGCLAFRAVTGRSAEPSISAATCSPEAPSELTALIDRMVGDPGSRPTASDVFERALWLCDRLEVAPLFERPRWTPPQGFVAEGVSPSPDEDSGGFAIRIGRARSG